MNTFGLHSINIGSFNLKHHTNYTYPREARNVLVTFLKAHNLILNILGYSRNSRISGCVRIGTGLIMCSVTLAIGERKATSGVIIRHWYDETLLTGITQIVRGALEAFAPSGRVVNALLDVVATVPNLGKEISAASTCQGCMEYLSHGPHQDPEYPFPFWLLNLA